MTVGPTATRVLLALLAEWEEHGRVTVRTVAARAGRSVQVTHKWLGVLRDAGLVAWEPGVGGTLRPLVRRVPMSVSPQA